MTQMRGAERIEAESLGTLDGVEHGFFTRRGGVSNGPFASLNCGFGSADAPACIAANRARVTALLGAAPAALITARQVHSARAVISDAPWPAAGAPEADAVVTARPGLAIAVLTADCAPVLLADATARIAAAAHAGWRGALDGVLEATIGEMERLGAERSRIRASVGPCISQSRYEVGEAFREMFLERDGESAAFFTRSEETAKPRFDLPGYVLHRLRRAGLESTENQAACTYENESKFFSFRRVSHRFEVDYGRQISAILLK